MEFIARSCCRLFLTFWSSFEVSSIICSACILWHPDRPKRGPVQRALRKALRRSNKKRFLVHHCGLGGAVSGVLNKYSLFS